MTVVRFEGHETWPIDNEIVELVVGGRRFDLHNDADLTELAIKAAAGSEAIALTFRARPLAPGSASDQVTLVVEFRGVSSLELNADLAAQHEAGVFFAFEYLGGQSLGFETDFLAVRLEAESVVVTVLP
ncbi:hypothetical protein [Pengzhenrongella sp.]|uniref:hypothetical protein n=1 Tax=Pengzhenrongella sp. TaxID=2888820 RepID=UPI002F92A4EC